MSVNRKSQYGFSLVAALFLLIVLSTLGAVAVLMTAVQQQTVVFAMQSARALAAARSGVEWSAYQALVNDSCTNTTLTLTEAGLSGFSVDTTCSSTTHTEGPDSVKIYLIGSFAYAGVYGTPDYVSRRWQTTLTDAS